jgi:hypothetical protein
VTEDEAFKILAAENLAGFGWNLVAEDIPDFWTVDKVWGRVGEWWKGLSHDTRLIIGELDLTDGIWNLGWLEEFPAFYTVLSGNAFGRFSDTMNDARAAIAHAHDHAPDYAAQHAVGRLEDDPDLTDA